MIPFRLLLILTLVILTAKPAQAQDFYLLPTGQWVEDHYYAYGYNPYHLYDDQNKVMDTIRPPRPPALLAAAQSKDGPSTAILGKPFSLRPIYYEGRWASAGMHGGDRRIHNRWEVFFREGKEWIPKGEFKLSPRVQLHTLIPVSEERILLVTSPPSGTQMSPQAWDAWSPVEVYRRTGKESWALERTLDLNLTRAQKEGISRDLMRSQFALCGTRLVICAPVQALLRVIDLERLRCTRERSLFEPLPEGLEPKTMDSNLAVVLGVYPTRDGNLLLCTRSRNAWNNLGKLTLERLKRVRSLVPATESADSMAMLGKNLRQGRDEHFRLYPDLWWWEFDPVTGRLEQLGLPPKGCIDFYRSMETLGSQLMNYRPHLDGSIRPLRGEGAWRAPEKPEATPEPEAAAPRPAPIAPGKTIPHETQKPPAYMPGQNSGS